MVICHRIIRCVLLYLVLKDLESFSLKLVLTFWNNELSLLFTDLSRLVAPSCLLYNVSAVLLTRLLFFRCPFYFVTIAFSNLTLYSIKEGRHFLCRHITITRYNLWLKRDDLHLHMTHVSLLNLIEIYALMDYSST